MKQSVNQNTLRSKITLLLMLTSGVLSIIFFIMFFQDISTLAKHLWNLLLETSATTKILTAISFAFATFFGISYFFSRHTNPVSREDIQKNETPTTLSQSDQPLSPKLGSYHLNSPCFQAVTWDPKSLQEFDVDYNKFSQAIIQLKLKTFLTGEKYPPIDWEQYIKKPMDLSPNNETIRSIYLKALEKEDEFVFLPTLLTACAAYIKANNPEYSDIEVQNALKPLLDIKNGRGKTLMETYNAFFKDRFSEELEPYDVLMNIILQPTHNNEQSQYSPLTSSPSSINYGQLTTPQTRGTNSPFSPPSQPSPFWSSPTPRRQLFCDTPSDTTVKSLIP